MTCIINGNYALILSGEREFARILTNVFKYTIRGRILKRE